MQEKYLELHLLNRPGKQGGASAFLQSFEYGIKHNYHAMLAMDADFSHDPKYIPGMLEKIEEYDVVIGSRLAKGGGIENRSLLRNIISSGASLYCRVLLMFSVKDWTGGYNLWSKKALEKIGITSIFTRGYSFQIEMKYKAHRAGCTIIEIPVIFPDRKKGVSKMSASYFTKALIDVWRIKFSCIKNNLVKQMFKFAVTGGLGTITNLVIFFLCVDKGGLPEIPVSVFCFLVAGTQNYIINHTWSFADRNRKIPPPVKQWALFLCASLLGLAVNIAVMTFIIKNFNPPYKFIAQAGGIAAGMILNFTLSKLLVWRKKTT